MIDQWWCLMLGKYMLYCVCTTTRTTTIYCIFLLD